MKLNDNQFIAVRNCLYNLIHVKKIKARKAIALVFKKLLTLLPSANPSDLWHLLIYPAYLDFCSEQSWVRVSGEAFEVFLAAHYTAAMKPYGIRVRPSFSRKAKFNWLEQMKLTNSITSSKLDLVIERNGIIIGCIHCKVSLADRISEDVPASQILMEHGFLSLLCTLDVKSFPDNKINKGEFGSPSKPTDKRRYVEEFGHFDACFSYNTRTIPSQDITVSGKKIFIGNARTKHDSLTQYILQ